MQKIKQIIIFSFVLSFFVLSPALSIKLPIGEQCTSNSDCESNDCEGSTKIDTKGDSMSFCDCDEADFSIAGGDTSQDCADRYKGAAEDWTCKNGAATTWKLDYCLHNTDIKKTEYPVLPLDKPSLVDHVLDPTAVLSTLPKKDIKPNLQVTLPGLEFSKSTIIEKIGASGKQTTFINVPYLGEYLLAVYSYAIVVASILTVVFIIIGGLQWTISGGSPEKIKSAQKKIVGAMTGLIIALLSYTLLNIINPNLTNLSNLHIRYVEGISIDEILRSGQPGDEADWERLKEEGKVSLLENVLNKIDNIKMAGLLLIKPNIAFAAPSVFKPIYTELAMLKDFYTKNQSEYSKMNPSITIEQTKLDADYIQKGACLDWPTKNLYGDEARVESVKFALYLNNLNIVSYAFGGRGAPCALEPKNKDPLNSCDKKQSKQGNFKCTPSINQYLKSTRDGMLTWNLDYCLDCSGFAHTIFKCGAQKFVQAKTGLLFGCAADPRTKDMDPVILYQPIPRSETKPGDIVGYQASSGIPVGHVMVCINNGCTQVIHVEGPQAFRKDNIEQALKISDKAYLDKLEKKRKKEAKGTFKFEFRRIMALDYEHVDDIPRPTCDSILVNSLCRSYVNRLKNNGSCI